MTAFKIMIINWTRFKLVILISHRLYSMIMSACPASCILVWIPTSMSENQSFSMICPHFTNRAILTWKEMSMSMEYFPLLPLTLFSTCLSDVIWIELTSDARIVPVETDVTWSPTIYRLFARNWKISLKAYSVTLGGKPEVFSDTQRSNTPSTFGPRCKYNILMCRESSVLFKPLSTVSGILLNWLHPLKLMEQRYIFLSPMQYGIQINERLYGTIIYDMNSLVFTTHSEAEKKVER